MLQFPPQIRFVHPGCSKLFPESSLYAHAVASALRASALSRTSQVLILALSRTSQVLILSLQPLYQMRYPPEHCSDTCAPESSTHSVRTLQVLLHVVAVPVLLVWSYPGPPSSKLQVRHHLPGHRGLLP